MPGALRPASCARQGRCRLAPPEARAGEPNAVASQLTGGNAVACVRSKLAPPELPDSAMRCTAYRTRTDHLLLVPDCMVATREAERRFGPLQACGLVDTDRLPPPLQDAVERDFEARSYHRLADAFLGTLGMAGPDRSRRRDSLAAASPLTTAATGRPATASGPSTR